MKKSICLSFAFALLAGGCAASRDQASALPISYHGKEYGFTFLLSADWRGYSTLMGQWEGTSYSPTRDATVVAARGPMIILRHLRWRVEVPYQDIPIMVFTRKQWNAAKEGGFCVGAGGCNMELWHNEGYVFALSSRYNAADDVVGWKEVTEIVEKNRTVHEMPRLYTQ